MEKVKTCNNNGSFMGILYCVLYRGRVIGLCRDGFVFPQIYIDVEEAKRHAARITADSHKKHYVGILDVKYKWKMKKKILATSFIGGRTVNVNRSK